MAARLLILGAKGGVGLHCARRALELESVVAVASGRGATEHEMLNKMLGVAGPTRLELLNLDVTDATALEAAVGNCDAAIFCCSAASSANNAAVDDQAPGVLGRLCAAAGVPVVQCSSQLVDPKNRWSPIRILINTIAWGKMDAKFAGEQKMRASGARYVILRPGRLEDGELNRGSCSLGQNDSVGNYMPQNGSTRADVANALVTIALHAVAEQQHPLQLTVEMGCESVPSPISGSAEDVRKDIVAQLTALKAD